jgi:hypothetical protein
MVGGVLLFSRLISPSAPNSQLAAISTRSYQVTYDAGSSVTSPASCRSHGSGFQSLIVVVRRHWPSEFSLKSTPSGLHLTQCHNWSLNRRGNYPEIDVNDLSIYNHLCKATLNAGQRV